MSKLQFSTAQENGKTVLTLIGQIDESFPQDLHNIKPGAEMIINLDQVKRAQGMNITFVTTAQSDEECVELLRLLGVPFKNLPISVAA